MIRHANCRNACTSLADCDNSCVEAEKVKPLVMGRAVPGGLRADVPTLDDVALAPLIQSLKLHMKDTNPKDAIGATKLPLHLVPAPLMTFAALAFHEGAVKYGAFNWRRAGARASVYYSALMRHMLKWFNGEEADPETGVPHLASAIACLAVLADVIVANTLVDDRPPSLPLSAHIDSAPELLARLSAKHAGLNPQHHTEKDA